jgi:hypothetical protein
MTTFDTPEPISVTFELGVADVRIVASDRRDTIVEVRPRDSAKKSDVAAARQTRVEYDNGRLLIKAPKGRRQFSFFGSGSESIVVDVELPAGSQVRGTTAVATVQCRGRIGDCDFKTSAGGLHFAQTGTTRLKSSSGDLTVEHAAGDVQLSTALGEVRIEKADGAAVVKNSHGDTWIGEVSGDLRVNSARGKIVVEEAGAAVEAKTAHGDIRLLDVRRGEVVAHTALGKVEIGVRDGVAAWLDLKTSHGNVQSDLDASAPPAASEDAVEVSARTAFGDITIRRATKPRAVSSAHPTN